MPKKHWAKQTIFVSELKEDKSGSYGSEWGLCVPSDLLKSLTKAEMKMFNYTKKDLDERAAELILLPIHWKKYSAWQIS